MVLSETSPLREIQQRSKWLSTFALDVTSQSGEDGILSKALDVLPERSGWCVEFGAWDGRKYSNTYNLVNSLGYRGVFIEADSERFRDLEKTHSSQVHVLLNALVGVSEKDGLDALLEAHPVPREFDLLSIDIDGNDFHVWAAVRIYRPKLVIIEYNPTAANSVYFVQPCDPSLNQGASAAALVRLARSKGYELIAVTTFNLLFVAQEYYPLFSIPDNSLALLRDDSGCPQIFFGYDGHVFLAQNEDVGSAWLPWHGLAIPESKVQRIPRLLQRYPDNYSGIERFLYRCRFQFPRSIFQRIRRGVLGRIRVSS